jgi:hypothetical protein
VGGAAIQLNHRKTPASARTRGPRPSSSSPAWRAVQGARRPHALRATQAPRRARRSCAGKDAEINLSVSAARGLVVVLLNSSPTCAATKRNWGMGRPSRFLSLMSNALIENTYNFRIRRVLRTARPETTIFSVRSLISSPPVKLPTAEGRMRCQPD